MKTQNRTQGKSKSAVTAAQTKNPFAHVDLESTVYETNAVLELLGESLVKHLEGENQGSIASGIVGLVHSTQTKLAASFSAAHREYGEIRDLAKGGAR